MKHSGPRSRTMLLLAALAISLSACGQDSDSDENTNAIADENSETTVAQANTVLDGDQEQLTLMLNWTPNAHHAGIYLAEAEGWYTEAGIDLKIIPADVAETAVASGAADVGIAQAESLLPARAEGIEVTAVATLLPSNDSSLMSLTSEEVDSPKDLEGLTYGGFGGPLETELISKLVECDGGDPSKVDFVEVGDVDYVAGLEQDRFDFVWVFEGWDVVRANALEDTSVDTIKFKDHLDCIPNWDTPLLLTKTSEAESELTKTFLEVTERGYKAVSADPKSGASALKDAAPELDAELVDAAVEYYAPLYIEDGGSWGQMTDETWAEFSDFLVEAELLEDSSAAEDAFTNQSLSE